MPYIDPETILEIRKIDVLTYLQNYEPDNLIRYSRNTFCTKEHDSLKISNGKWMWFSQGIGGASALDYLCKVKGMSFLEAVELLATKKLTPLPINVNYFEKPDPPLLLPEKNRSNDVVKRYLMNRGIDVEIIDFCFENELIFESVPHHNAVFIGYDNHKNPKYAAFRATNPSRVMGDCSGSKKDYSFRFSGTNKDEVHLFESAVDLLSFATLYKLNGGNWKELNLISLSGVYAPSSDLTKSKVPKALQKYLENNLSLKRIVLHLDNDIAGRRATKALEFALSNQLEVVDDPPRYGKDINDFLCFKLNIKSIKERNYER